MWHLLLCIMLFGDWYCFIWSLKHIALLYMHPGSSPLLERYSHTCWPLLPTYLSNQRINLTSVFWRQNTHACTRFILPGWGISVDFPLHLNWKNDIPKAVNLRSCNQKAENLWFYFIYIYLHFSIRALGKNVHKYFSGTYTILQKICWHPNSTPIELVGHLISKPQALIGSRLPLFYEDIPLNIGTWLWLITSVESPSAFKHYCWVIGSGPQPVPISFQRCSMVWALFKPVSFFQTQKTIKNLIMCVGALFVLLEENRVLTKLSLQSWDHKIVQ